MTYKLKCSQFQYIIDLESVTMNALDLDTYTEFDVPNFKCFMYIYPTGHH